MISYRASVMAVDVRGTLEETTSTKVGDWDSHVPDRKVPCGGLLALAVGYVIPSQ